MGNGRFDKYQKAKEDVLFNGFEIIEEQKSNEDNYLIFNKNKFWCVGKKKLVTLNKHCNYISDLTGQPITENYFKFLD